MTPRAVDTLVMMKVKRRDGEDRWEVEEKDGRQVVRQKKPKKVRGGQLATLGAFDTPVVMTVER